VARKKAPLALPCAQSVGGRGHVGQHSAHLTMASSVASGGGGRGLTVSVVEEDEGGGMGDG